jgi:hypothetical protein
MATLDVFEAFEDFDDSAYRTFADVLADREASSTQPRTIDQKVNTGVVTCLSIVDRPRGCSGAHCELAPKCCQEKACIGRLREQMESLKRDSASKVVEISKSIEAIEDVLVEISVHCRTDSLYYPTMEESRSALELALANNIDIGTCECVACQLSFEQKNAKILKQKLNAAEIRHRALDEYRRAHDKEALARTNEG